MSIADCLNRKEYFYANLPMIVGLLAENCRRKCSRKRKPHRDKKPVQHRHSGRCCSQKKRKRKQPINLIDCFYGAGDEARTRYLHLGKVALYQMSYTRMSCGTLTIIAEDSRMSRHIYQFKKIFLDVMPIAFHQTLQETVLLVQKGKAVQRSERRGK